VQLYGVKKRWWFVERWAPARRERRRILDIGCATGVFLAAGSDGWSKVGVELSPSAAQLAREHFGLTVYQGTVEEAPLTTHSFDAITMWDVLEHVYDPLGTLRRVHELLRPDGILIGRVPNIDSWEARLSGRYWAGLDQPRHIFVPSEATLDQLLQRAGFKMLDYQCLSGSAGMLALSWRFWLRRRAWQARWQQLARAAFDNLAMRLAVLPALWLVDKVFKKGALLTFAARPV
jgi:SAM-dependent methyltransferase